MFLSYIILFTLRNILEISNLDSSPYNTISTTHYCGHSHGGFPDRCVIQTSDCEEKCTSHDDWCVGYSFEAASNCALITSSGNCEDGMKHKAGRVALSAQDLKASSYKGYNCVIKKSI